MTAYKTDAKNLPSYLLDATVEPDQHPDTHQEVILTSGVLIAMTLQQSPTWKRPVCFLIDYC